MLRANTQTYFSLEAAPFLPQDSISKLPDHRVEKFGVIEFPAEDDDSTQNRNKTVRRVL